MALYLNVEQIANICNVDYAKFIILHASPCMTSGLRQWQRGGLSYNDLSYNGCNISDLSMGLTSDDSEGHEHHQCSAKGVRVRIISDLCNPQITQLNVCGLMPQGG